MHHNLTLGLIGHLKRLMMCAVPGVRNLFKHVSLLELNFDYCVLL